MNIKKILEKVISIIPETYFVGVFDEGGLMVDFISNLEEIEPETASAVAEDIIQAIKAGLETRSKQAYGDFEEAIIETESARVVLVSVPETTFGIVGFFNDKVPIGLIKTAMEKSKELLLNLGGESK